MMADEAADFPGKSSSVLYSGFEHGMPVGAKTSKRYYVSYNRPAC